MGERKKGFQGRLIEGEDMQSEVNTVDPLVQREIREAEQLLWWGRPNVTRCGNYKSIKSIKRSIWIPLGGAALLSVLAIIFFFLHAFKGTLSLLLLVLVFFLLYSLPKRVQKYQAARRVEQALENTVYALTDQRILVLIKIRGNVSSYSFTKSEVGKIEKIERLDGWGDILFARQSQSNAQQKIPPCLEGIPNVRQVEWLLLKTFKESESVPPSHP